MINGPPFGVEGDTAPGAPGLWYDSHEAGWHLVKRDEEVDMFGMKAAAVVGVLMLAMAGPALAFNCTNLMGNVDHALGKASDLTAQQRDEIKALRAEGVAKHAAGNHGGSVVALKKAMAILGQNPNGLNQ